MATWKILSQTVTSKGHPREFGFLEHLGEKTLVHVVAAERSGGGSDDGMPRRCLAIGTDRASARRSLEATIRRYDPSGTIVEAR